MMICFLFFCSEEILPNESVPFHRWEKVRFFRQLVKRIVARDGVANIDPELLQWVKQPEGNSLTIIFCYFGQSQFKNFLI
jgi:hypothetical protein